MNEEKLILIKKNASKLRKCAKKCYKMQIILRLKQEEKINKRRVYTYKNKE